MLRGRYEDGRCVVYDRPAAGTSSIEAIAGMLAYFWAFAMIRLNCAV